jgi:hypothetical protein
MASNTGSILDYDVIETFYLHASRLAVSHCVISLTDIIEFTPSCRLVDGYNGL